MFTLYCKLKHLKKKHRTLNRSEFGNLSDRVKTAKVSLDEAQSRLLNATEGDKVLEMPRVQEASKHYYFIAGLEESFFKQKARIRWLQLGDCNSTYFFNSLKVHHNRNNVASLTLEDGSSITEPEAIANEVQNHFIKRYSAVPNFQAPSSVEINRVLRS